jgi:hypothetical protein
VANGRNWRIDGKAAVERGGQTKLNSSTLTNPIHSMGHFYSDGGTTFLLGFVGTTLKDIDATPATISRTAGSWSGNATDIAVMNDAAYFADGGVLQKWTGSGSTTAVASGPEADILITHPTANRLFANDVDNPRRVQYSALAEPDDWTTLNDAGFFDVPFTEGESLTAFGVAPSGFLLIFSQSSTHILSGTDDPSFNRREIDPQIGCRAPNSIAAGRGGVYFLGNNNRVYWNNGNANIPVGKNVEGILDSGSTGDYPNAQAWVEGTRYHLAISIDGSTNDTVLVLDWSANGGKGAWTIDDSIEVSGVSVDRGGTELVYTGDYDGFVQKQDTGVTDNGTAVAAYLETAAQVYEEPERRKKAKRTYVKYVPMTGSMSIDVAKDGSTFTNVADVDMAGGGAALDDSDFGLDDPDTALDGGETERNTRVSNIRNCRSLQHKFSFTTQFKLLGYSQLLRKKFAK